MPTSNLHPALARLIRIVTWTENALLIGMLALMVLLAAAQILFRNFLDMSIFGADQMLRLLVLWVAFLGAVAASREGKHIHVDAIARWLPGRVKSGVVALTDVSGAVATGTVDGVGRDCFDLTEHAPDEPRRPENVTGRRLVPFAAVACLQPAGGSAGL